MYNHNSKDHRQVIAFWRRVFTVVVVAAIVALVANVFIAVDILFR